MNLVNAVMPDTTGDPTLVDLTSNIIVLCTNVQVYLMNYS